MWDKKEGKDVAPGSFATGTGYASAAPSQGFQSSGRVVNIGQTIFIKGELTGDEDLTIEGRVEGKIELKDHNLIIGPNGKINAEINAKSVTVIGSVVGNISASEMVEIKSSGTVMGDIKSSRISIADGAHFKGSVDMQKGTDTSKKFELPKPEAAKVSSDQST